MTDEAIEGVNDDALDTLYNDTKCAVIPKDQHGMESIYEREHHHYKKANQHCHNMDKVCAIVKEASTDGKIYKQNECKEDVVMGRDCIYGMKEIHQTNDNSCNMIGMEIDLVQKMKGTNGNNRNTSTSRDKVDSFSNIVICDVPIEEIPPKPPYNNATIYDALAVEIPLKPP